MTMDVPVSLTAGVDVGSSGVKVAVVRSRGGEEAEILAVVAQRIRRRDLSEVVESAWQEGLAAAGVGDPESLDYVATTGEADSVAFRTGHFYSMTTHARGCALLAPGASGVLDVGALHARAIRILPGGRVAAHRMTSQCASGTGQFLENIARYLGVPQEDVGRLSKEESRAPETVSSICAVLAETDVINMVSRGIGPPDILKGIHASIAGRLVQLVRAIGVEGSVLVTGGLSRDEGLLACLGEAAEAGPKRKRLAVAHSPLEFLSHPQAIHAGAIGAALLGAYRREQLRRSGRLDMLMTG